MSGICTVTIGGQAYTGWKSVRVRRSLGEAAATFDLEIVESSGGEFDLGFWKIRPGAPCTVSLDGVQVVDGFVDVRQASYAAESHGVRVSGRSKTADLVDSSAIEKGGQFRDYTVGQIAQRFTDRHGIQLKIIGPEGAPFPDAQIDQGETEFEMIDRLARQRGLAVHDNEFGDLVLDRIDLSATPVATLAEGINIEAASATIRMDQRHSEYVVKGQRAATDQAFGRDAAQVIARATDASVTRFRPLMIVAEHAGDTEALRERADWEVATRAGESVEAHVTVVGWSRVPGSLWWPGDIYRLRSPMLLIDRPMLAKSVDWSQDDQSGTLTQIQLAPPESMTPETGASSAAGSANQSASGGGAPATTPATGGEFEVDRVWMDTKPQGRAQ